MAALFSLRSNPQAGLTTLVSAEINQLTLLIGSMVFIFSMSVGQPVSFPLESRQTIEIILTSIVSMLGIVLIAPRVIGWKAGMSLLSLFITHFFFVDITYRRLFVFIYLSVTTSIVILDWRRVSQGIVARPNK